MAKQREIGGREGNADNRCDEESAERDEADCLAAFAPGAGGKHKRQHADDEAPRRHHDCAEPSLCAAYRRTRDSQSRALFRVGVFDHQYRVLRRKADQHDEAELRIDGECSAGERKRGVSARDGEYDGEHHAGGKRPALVLRDKEEVREEAGERQKRAEAALVCALLAGDARPFDVIARLKWNRLDLAHELRRASRRDADRDGRARLLVEAVDLPDAWPLLEGAERGEGHERTVLVHHLQLAQRFGRGAECVVGLDDDVVVVPAVAEVVYVMRRHDALERGEEAVHRDAE